MMIMNNNNSSNNKIIMNDYDNNNNKITITIIMIILITTATLRNSETVISINDTPLCTIFHNMYCIDTNLFCNRDFYEPLN